MARRLGHVYEQRQVVCRSGPCQQVCFLAICEVISRLLGPHFPHGDAAQLPVGRGAPGRLRSCGVPGQVSADAGRATNVSTKRSSCARSGAFPSATLVTLPMTLPARTKTLSATNVTVSPEANVALPLRRQANESSPFSANSMSFVACTSLIRVPFASL